MPTRSRNVSRAIGAAVAAGSISAQGTISGGGLDSDSIVNLIDSNYVAAREADAGGGGGITNYSFDSAEGFLTIDSSGLTAGTLGWADAANTLAVWNDSDGKWQQISFEEYPIGDVPAGSGGTESTYIDGATTYKIHTFTSSGNFVASKSITSLEYLVVAGGGSGAGYYYSGGGGAGGYRTSLTGATSGRNTSAESKLSIIAGTYSVVVGAGGAPLSVSAQGNNGSDSTFATITSIGGGGGGYNANGSDGGSGGGAGQGSGKQGGTGTAGQGYDGGDLSSSGNTYGAGGGGGAASAGQNGAVGDAGDGGGGLSLSFDASQAVFRSGGGGGASGANAGYGSGGVGGGGDGGAYSGAIAPTDGTVNTGGGGGGASHIANASGTASGAGGSGIVIIRYPI